jgi:membrane protease YdiL (CAAX protease family)
LLAIVSTYKIAEMAVGLKSLPQDNVTGAAWVGGGSLSGWAEVFIVFALLEAVFWTPRSRFHSFLIVSLVVSVTWFALRGHSREELGLVWPSRRGVAWILAVGCTVAVAIPTVARLMGQAIPANPDWPKFQNLWPYVIWAFAQQFLLLSFFYVRTESLVGTRSAMWASTILFTLAHLPNATLTALTLVGALFFTEMFRRYRSIYPLGIVHALLGVAIAYSFPNRLMHHMRVGLSFWQLR